MPWAGCARSGTASLTVHTSDFIFQQKDGIYISLQVKTRISKTTKKKERITMSDWRWKYLLPFRCICQKLVPFSFITRESSLLEFSFRAGL